MFGGESMWLSIADYEKLLGVTIEVIDGEYYVSLKDYENLIVKLAGVTVTH